MGTDRFLCYKGRPADTGNHMSQDPSDFDAFIRHLALERRLSPRTVQAYRQDLSALSTFLERSGSSLRSATYAHLRRWLAHQGSRGYARSTIARRAAAVRTFY